MIGAVAIIGAFWYVGRARRALSPSSIVVMALMAGIVLIADAKQVAFALPVVLLAQRSLSTRSIAIGLAVLLTVYAVVHVRTVNQGYAVPYIDRALAGHSGKQAVALMIWGATPRRSRSARFFLGQGPAETVSRAAFETLPQFQDTGSAGSISSATRPHARDNRGSGTASCGGCLGDTLAAGGSTPSTAVCLAASACSGTLDSLASLPTEACSPHLFNLRRRASA